MTEFIEGETAAPEPTIKRTREDGTVEERVNPIIKHGENQIDYCVDGSPALSQKRSWARLLAFRTFQ
uniref:Uncharacterized protein n=1 Tax=Nymphaea colorata TaxID=210225 RepID=A0A5K1H2W4_9MAGN|nr:unnamed protein product [Nymphaea colorata]